MTEMPFLPCLLHLRDRFRALAFLFALTAVACSDQNQAAQDSASEGSTQIDFSSYDSLPQFELRETLRIGDENAGVVFGSIRDVGVAQNGDIYVLDGSFYQILAFSEDARLLHKFGREGEGPGEFAGQVLRRLAVGEDTIFVLDEKLHAFRLNGDFLYTVVPQLEEFGSPHTRPPFVSAGSGLIAVWNHTSRSNVREGQFTEDTMWVRIRPNGSDDFLAPGLPFSGMRMMKMRRGSASERFGAVPVLAISPSGQIFYARGDLYSIDQFDFTGSRVARVTGEVDRVEIPYTPPEPMSKEMLDRIANSMPPGMDLKSMTDRGDLPTAKFRPIIGRLIAGDSGVLLVERRDIDSDDDNATSNWDMLDMDGGRLLGRLKIPRWFTPYTFRGGRLYGSDIRVVPQLVRLDIIR